MFVIQIPLVVGLLFQGNPDNGKNLENSDYLTSSEKLKKHLELINQKKTVLSLDEYLLILKNFDKNKSLGKQSEIFLKKFAEARSKNCYTSAELFREFEIKKFRLSFDGFYSNNYIKIDNEIIASANELANAINSNYSFKFIDSELPSLLALAYSSDDAMKKIIYNAVVMQICHDIPAQNKKSSLWSELLSVKLLTIDSISSELRSINDDRANVNMEIDAIDMKKSPDLSKYINGNYYIERHLARRVAANNKPSEVKANLKKYLLKPGSYYDILITDYANIPEPKPEKKP